MFFPGSCQVLTPPAENRISIIVGDENTSTLAQAATGPLGPRLNNDARLRYFGMVLNIWFLFFNY